MTAYVYLCGRLCVVSSVTGAGWMSGKLDIRKVVKKSTVMAELPRISSMYSSMNDIFVVRIYIYIFIF